MVPEQPTPSVDYLKAVVVALVAALLLAPAVVGAAPPDAEEPPARREFGDITGVAGFSTLLGVAWGPAVGANIHLGRNAAFTARLKSYSLLFIPDDKRLMVSGPMGGFRLQGPIGRTLLFVGARAGPIFELSAGEVGVDSELNIGWEYLAGERLSFGMEFGGRLIVVTRTASQTYPAAGAMLHVGYEF